MAAIQQRIQRSSAGLLVIDFQERLLPAIAEKECVVDHAVRLIHGARILGLPIWLTEQYPRGLGHTVSEIIEALPETRPIEKVSFSAATVPDVRDALTESCVQDVILCGIESHVCVSQTCLDLLAEQRRVFVVADAMSSRATANHRIGLERMHGAGAQIVSVEMILFELLERAGTDEFKAILNWVK